MQTEEGGNNKVVMDAVAAPPSASNVAAAAASAPADANAATATAAAPVAPPPRKKKPKKRNKESTNDDQQPRKKPKAKRRATTAAASQDLPGLSAAQLAVNEQMRRALEEDQYSALGSIVEDDDSDDEQEDEHAYLYRGQPVRLDRAALITAVRKHNLLERLGALGKPVLPVDDEEEEEDEDDNDGDDENIAETDEADKVSSKKTTAAAAAAANAATRTVASSVKDVTEHEAKDKSSSIGVDPLGFDLGQEDDLDRDGGSIFGQTTGAGNSTWVECDKCKKWRRLRGVVDEKKLPSKWYCSMNKNDPERARCSAPEEEYEASHTPESAADARTRKHLRVWVRRLQCNEAYEARQPTLTRGKKRAAASSSKDPYEWVRCCNPSCGKWRAILRIMDAKGNVIDRTKDGEWYCVMNTWDEKIASCAAPQENLPAVGCPPWVMQDE